MPATVKLMIAFQHGIVVCTEDNELWFGWPSWIENDPWFWRRI